MIINTVIILKFIISIYIILNVCIQIYLSYNQNLIKTPLKLYNQINFMYLIY